MTRDERGFTVLVRGAMFQLLRAFARRDYAGAALLVSAPDGQGTGSDGETAWGADRFAQALAPFYEEHDSIRVDPVARAPVNTRIEKPGRGVWDIEQVISDGDDDNDWRISCYVDLERSAREGKPVVVMRALSR